MLLNWTRREAALSLASACTATALTVGIVLFIQRRSQRKWRCEALRPRAGYDGLVGGTPMVELSKLSRILRRRVLCKAEFLNPGGTAKDRVARRVLDEAEAAGRLLPGGTVVEGTSGSTGIALAALCRARGYRCVVFLPDDQAEEKRRLLQTFGADVRVVRTAGFANPEHYVKKAERFAADTPGAVFMDQFETLANFRAHLTTSGPEVWEQAVGGCGRLDAFVMSAGTGGMIAGVSRYLKTKSRDVKVVLADPQGSSLFARVAHGVAFAQEQKERGVKLHRYDTIAEGIGLDRITANLEKALVAPSSHRRRSSQSRRRAAGPMYIDGAVQVTDQEALDMAHWLLEHEGLFVGSSSAINMVAAARVARRLPENSVVVTVLCDSGQRHLTRFWNRDFVEGFQGRGLKWPAPRPCEEPAAESADVENRVFFAAAERLPYFQ